jgi:hypothetical protein
MDLSNLLFLAVFLAVFFHMLSIVRAERTEEISRMGHAPPKITPPKTPRAPRKRRLPKVNWRKWR